MKKLVLIAALTAAALCGCTSGKAGNNLGTAVDGGYNDMYYGTNGYYYDGTYTYDNGYGYGASNGTYTNNGTGYGGTGYNGTYYGTGTGNYSSGTAVR